MSGAVVSAVDLVKAVDAAVKAAADNEPSRAVDSLQFLTKQDVTASLLLSTGAGKKVRCMSIQAAWSWAKVLSHNALAPIPLPAHTAALCSRQRPSLCYAACCRSGNWQSRRMQR
jgi:hypothetical protein